MGQSLRNEELLLRIFFRQFDTGTIYRRVSGSKRRQPHRKLTTPTARTDELTALWKSVSADETPDPFIVHGLIITEQN